MSVDGGPETPLVADPGAGLEQTPAAGLGHLSTRLLFLKMVLVLTGLGLLLYWAGASLPADTGRITVSAVVLALLINQVGLYAAALRLRAVLAAFAIPISAGQAQSIHLRSIFYFFFVPMSVGLEISRFIMIRRLLPGSSARPLILALLLDRVLGMLAALLVALVLATLVIPGQLALRLDPVWIGGGVLVAGALGASLLLHPSLRLRALELLRTLVDLGPRLLWPILLAFASLLLVCASVYVFAISSGIEVGAMALVFALSVALLAMAIPLSLLGASLGEVAGVGALSLLGLAPSVAILLAAVVYCGRLVGAMQGALLDLWGDARRVWQPPLRQ
ncbi:MAG: hypothetical protein EOM91_11810 [Sphingobacteriia bacterium]|nr:hypothetical protein [Sphingobacteriia bacterium]NCC40387.1 hypothetical protein [Gammaproteobacteria bacterium]